MYFRGSWRTGETQRKPPSLSLRAAATSMSSSAAIDWYAGEAHNHLDVHFRLKVTHGPVTRFALRLPSGYLPGPIHLTPDDPAAIVSSSGSNWSLDPSRPWNTGQIIDLRFDLRGPALSFSGNHASILIPRIAPVSPMALDGTLTIHTGSGSAPRTAPWIQTHRRSVFCRRPLNLRDGDMSLSVERDLKRVPGEATPAAVPVINWQFEDLKLQARLDEAGCLSAVLRGVVHRASDRWLPMQLPAGAVVESVIVAGKWAEAIRAFDGNAVNVPWPAGDNVSFELQYRLSEPISGPLAKLPDIAPKLPGDAEIPIVWSSDSAYRFWPTLGRSSAGDSIVVVHHGVLLVGFVLIGSLLITALFFLKRRFGRAGIWMAALALLAATAVSILADPTDSATVYLRREANGVTVFAQRTLLERLDQMAANERPAVAFSAAAIRGREEDSQAIFDLTFTANVGAMPTKQPRCPCRGWPSSRPRSMGNRRFPRCSPASATR